MNMGTARAPTGDAVAWLSPAKPAAQGRGATSQPASDAFADILSGLTGGQDANGAPAADPASQQQANLDGLPRPVRREPPSERDSADAGNPPPPKDDPASPAQASIDPGTAYLAALLLPNMQSAAAADAATARRVTPPTSPAPAQPAALGPTPDGAPAAQPLPGAVDAAHWHDSIAEPAALPAPQAPVAVSVGRQETHFPPVRQGLPAAAAPQATDPEAADQDVASAPAQVAAAGLQSLDRGARPSRLDGAAPRRANPVPGAPAAPQTDDIESSDGIARAAAAKAAADEAGGSPSDGGSAAAPDSRAPDRRQPDATADLDAAAGAGRAVAASFAAALSPAGQIAETISAALQGAGPGAATGAAGLPTPATLNRVLNIALEPAHLGNVAIKMRITGDRLEVQVEVARGGTLDALTKDQGSLSAALRASGYTVDAMTITSMNAGGAPSGGGQHGTHEPARQPTPQFAGQSAQSGGSQDHQARDNARGGAPSEDASAARRSTGEAARTGPDPGSVRGGIYV